MGREQALTAPILSKRTVSFPQAGCDTCSLLRLPTPRAENMGANGGCRHLNGKRGALTPGGRNSWGLGFRRRRSSNLAQAHVLLPELTLSKAEVVVPASPAATAPPSSAQDLLSLTDLGTSVKVEPRRGDDIFGDGPYPRAFHEFVGQDLAKQQLITAINSARIRQQRMDHTLLASGTPGIGKTSLAKLCAASLGSVGYVELSGTVTEKDARQPCIPCRTTTCCVLTRSTDWWPTARRTPSGCCTYSSTVY